MTVKTKNLTLEQINEINSKEPLLQETLGRYTLFPIKYPDLWEMKQKHQKLLWVANEIRYEDDISDWEELSSDEQYFIETIFAFFAQSDNIVLENLMENFSKDIQIPEGRSFYSVQGYIESVHAETYGRHIITLIKDPKRREELFNAITTIPCIAKKANWARKWMDPTKATYAQRLIAFAVVEGVFFSGSFCSIFWLKSRGLMTKGIGTSNEFIARDETLHCNFAVLLYNNYIVNKLDTETIHDIFKEAIEIEIEFITESLPCRLIGMNSELMIQYVKFVANYWLTKLNYPVLFEGIENPFSFMVMNDIEGKTNFFEKPVSEYSTAYGVNSASDREIKVSKDFSEDF